MPLKIPTTNPTSGFDESSFKYSPLEHVRALFVGFFQGLFHASPTGAYHWEPDDELSEIYITDENVIGGESIGARPAISCTRGPVQFYSLGLDDMMAYDMQTGTKRKSVLVPGTMVINCSSRISLESERIAWICAEQLWLHRELLMQAGFFEIGRQPAIGSPSPAGSLIAGDMGDEWYVTAVTCPFQFYRTSQTSPLGKAIIRNLGVSIHTQLQRVVEMRSRIGGHGGPLESPTVEPPVFVEGHRPPAFAPLASDVYGNTPQAGQVAPVLHLVPHPLNPAQMVTMRGSRPNSPAIRPPGMGGRPIPIAVTRVEESGGNQVDGCSTSTMRIKV